MTLCACFTSCTNLEPGMTQAKEPFEIQQPATQTTPVIEQDNNILSKDYAVAEKALNKAFLEKNNNIVRLGLKNSILSIRLKTVEAIREINNETFVPSLIEALQENQILLEGGSEIQSFQEELNKTIISTLEQLTKLKFNLSNPISSKDIKEVLDKSQEWCKSNKEVCNTNFK
jgi:hypothetical protein